MAQRDHSALLLEAEVNEQAAQVQELPLAYPMLRSWVQVSSSFRVETVYTEQKALHTRLRLLFTDLCECSIQCDISSLLLTDLYDCNI